ncbi:hypothetical protein Tco_1570864 [Tanacetum coccineum]
MVTSDGMYELGFFSHGKSKNIYLGIWFKKISRGSVVQRIVLTWDERTQMLHWIERTQEWIVYADPGVDSFEPKFPQEWETSDWSNGCQRKKRLDYRSENGFREVSGVKLPDT